ncbi:MAG TPA: CARDB domain-containing protein, partial [Tepidisphaeraceae bacterium]|nr:CARDB domain-containing protein [Tepidisphaeraceae bacterium]
MSGHTTDRTGITRNHDTTQGHRRHRRKEIDRVVEAVAEALERRMLLSLAAAPSVIDVDDAMQPGSGQSEEASLDTSVKSDSASASRPEQAEHATIPASGTAQSELPDLVAHSLEWEPKVIYPGGSIRAWYTVENAGRSGAAESYVRLWLSMDGDWDTSDDYDLGEWPVISLYAQSSYTVICDAKIPQLPANCTRIWLIGQADSRSQIVESNEDNLCLVGATVADTLPDLQASVACCTSPYFTEDAPFYIQVHVYNAGVGNAGPSYARVWLSTDNDLDTSDDYDLGERLIDALDAGSSDYENWEFVMPKLGSGRYTIWVICQADSRGSVAETDENNLNKASMGLTMPDPTAPADLVPGNALWQGGIVAYEGQPFWIQTSVWNAGPGNAGASYARAWLSTDNDLETSDDYDLGEIPVPPVGAGSVITVRWDFTMPDLGAGNYAVSVICQLDSRAQVAESNERNQSKTTGLAASDPPQKPDLVAIGSNAKAATAFEQELFWVEAQVQNCGAVSAGPSIARMWLSTDNDLDPNDDYCLGERPVAALDSGSSDCPRWSFIMPNLGTGTYHVWLICQMDMMGQITESNEEWLFQFDTMLTVSDPPPTGRIEGSKWNDLNGNGVWDPTEPALPGHTIYLDQNLNGRLDSDELSTTTGIDGAYSFTDLVPGTYRVAEAAPPGWVQTYPAHEITPVEIAAGGRLELPPSGQQRRADYVIITTSAIQKGSIRLADFVAHKQFRGYT